MDCNGEDFALIVVTGYVKRMGADCGQTRAWMSRDFFEIWRKLIKGVDPIEISNRIKKKVAFLTKIKSGSRGSGTIGKIND